MKYKLNNNDLDFLRNLLKNSDTTFDYAPFTYFGNGHFCLSRTGHYGDSLKKGFSKAPSNLDYKVMTNLKRKKVLSNVIMDDGSFHMTLDLDYLDVVLADGFGDSKTDVWCHPMLVKDLFK